jgi:hypothetical protein
MRERRERKKRRRKKRGACPRPEEGRRNVDPSRPTVGSRRPWVELVASHTQVGHGSGWPRSGRLGSDRPPRPTALMTLFFYFLMGLASMGLIFLFFMMRLALGFVFSFFFGFSHGSNDY